MMPKVLVVEDEPAIRELLKVNLSTRDTMSAPYPTPKRRNAELNEALPDLLLLDWMLPGQIRSRSCERVARRGAHA